MRPQQGEQRLYKHNRFNMSLVSVSTTLPGDLAVPWLPTFCEPLRWLSRLHGSVPVAYNASAAVCPSV